MSHETEGYNPEHERNHTLRKRVVEKWKILSAALLSMAIAPERSAGPVDTEPVDKGVDPIEVTPAHLENLDDDGLERVEGELDDLIHVVRRDSEDSHNRKFEPSPDKPVKHNYFEEQDNLEIQYEPTPDSTLGDGVVRIVLGKHQRNIPILEEDVPILQSLLEVGVSKFGEDMKIHDYSVDNPDANVSYTEFYIQEDKPDAGYEDFSSADYKLLKQFTVRVRIDHTSGKYLVGAVTPYDKPVVIDPGDSIDVTSDDVRKAVEEKLRIFRDISSLVESGVSKDEIKEVIDSLIKAYGDDSFDFEHFGN